MNPTAIYALSLAGGGLTAVVGTVAYVAQRAARSDADRIAQAISRADALEALCQQRAARSTTPKELVR